MSTMQSEDREALKGHVLLTPWDNRLSTFAGLNPLAEVCSLLQALVLTPAPAAAPGLRVSPAKQEQVKELLLPGGPVISSA